METSLDADVMLFLGHCDLDLVSGIIVSGSISPILFDVGIPNLGC